MICNKFSENQKIRSYIDESVVLAKRYFIGKYVNYSSVSWMYEHFDILFNEKINDILTYGKIPNIFNHRAMKRCISELAKLNEAETPWCILDCFYNFQEGVYKSFDIALDRYEIAADDKLQMFNFLFVKAKIDQLYSKFTYLEDFIEKDENDCGGKIENLMVYIENCIQYLMEKDIQSYKENLASIFEENEQNSEED